MKQHNKVSMEKKTVIIVEGDTQDTTPKLIFQNTWDLGKDKVNNTQREKSVVVFPRRYIIKIAHTFYVIETIKP